MKASLFLFAKIIADNIYIILLCRELMLCRYLFILEKNLHIAMLRKLFRQEKNLWLIVEGKMDMSEIDATIIFQ